MVSPTITFDEVGIIRHQIITPNSHQLRHLLRLLRNRSSLIIVQLIPTILRPSYLHNGKMTSLYWIRAQSIQYMYVMGNERVTTAAVSAGNRVVDIKHEMYTLLAWCRSIHLSLCACLWGFNQSNSGWGWAQVYGVKSYVTVMYTVTDADGRRILIYGSNQHKSWCIRFVHAYSACVSTNELYSWMWLSIDLKWENRTTMWASTPP